MRRTFVTALALIAVGAALNVAVAWTWCVMSTQLEIDARRTGQLRAAEWHGHGSGAWIQDAFTNRGMEVARFREKIAAPAAQRARPIDRIFCRAGWPMLSLEGSSRMTSDGLPIDPPKRRWALPTDIEVTLAFGGLTNPRPTATQAILPLRPIWPGFAINTILYAGAIGLLGAAFFITRRLRRLSRGECPRCGYPAGHSDHCSECGATLREGARSEAAKLSS